MLIQATELLQLVLKAQENTISHVWTQNQPPSFSYTPQGVMFLM